MKRYGELKPPEDIQKVVTGDIRKLNKRLLEIAQGLETEIRKRNFSKTPPGVIVYAFYRNW